MFLDCFLLIVTIVKARSYNVYELLRFYLNLCIINPLLFLYKRITQTHKTCIHVQKKRKDKHLTIDITRLKIR